MNHFFSDGNSYVLDQSVRDVPCRVRFGDPNSLLRLSKWNGRASLVFSPGEKHEKKIFARNNELMLISAATPKEQHVFRRLDGDRFEYDVILLHEPESNRIDITLDFPDGLEFYRQYSEWELGKAAARYSPELFDSYAVYWKERNGPFKTGKFCHIYRPLIKDARGRSVWGDMKIYGHTLRITIPDDWLADAEYPVVVDPIVGTQTKGAYNTIDWWEEDNPVDFYLELEMGLSRFTAATPITGSCTSYIYSDAIYSAGGQAAVFSNSGSNPNTRLSRDEQVVSMQRSTPAWVPSTFTIPGTISPGSYFWYGYNARDYIETWYDRAGVFRWMDTEGLPGVPTTFSDPYQPEVTNVLISAYFSYSVMQNLTRSIFDTFGLTGPAARFLSERRACSDDLAGADFATRQGSCIRPLEDGVVSVDALYPLQTLFRFCVSSFTGLGMVIRSVFVFRTIESGLLFVAGLLKRLVLKKEELIIVSKITRKLEFKGYLL